MKQTFDTNVMVRLLIGDDAAQLTRAKAALDEAELIALPIVVLCETVWVLRTSYRLDPASIADVLARFLADERVRCDQHLADAGLACLRGGGDFADAVIAQDGRRLGAETFATFDRRAASVLSRVGEPVSLLA